jgi:hypothetical protein
METVNISLFSMLLITFWIGAIFGITLSNIFDWYMNK